MQPNKKLLRFLKQFFIQKPELHHPDDGHLLPTVEFYQLLDKERFRADRLGNPFSLVIIPLPEALQSPPRLRHITSHIHAQTRLIDELGWFAPGTLGLYLFNTPEAGAQVVLSRIREQLEYPELLDDIQVMVYPDTEVRSTLDEESEDNGDNRIQERLNLNLVATIQQVSGENIGPATTQTVTRDISASGAYLLTSTSLPEGTQLELEVLLPFEELRPLEASGKDIALKAIGHVVRSDMEGVAVQFVNSQNMKTFRKLKFDDLPQQ